MRTVEAAGLKIAYREQGTGPPVLLLHGWPTSSFLWRRVMEPIARANRVVALDLPGYGESDKPRGAGYGFDLYDRVLDEFLAALEIDEVGLAGHDLGGPIGLHWALHRPQRLTRLALLNTLVYPAFSEAVAQFITACTTPELRDRLTSPEGLAAAMRLGLADESKLTDEVAAAVAAPFPTEDARLALAEAGVGVAPEGFEEIARRLPSLRVPVRLVYGARDRILPDVAQTMERVARDVPGAELIALPGCGHFLQEEDPDEVGRLLAEFFA